MSEHASTTPSTTEPPAAAAPLPAAGRVAGVLGGGQMGAGIAHALLIAGAQVTVCESTAGAAAAAADRVAGLVAASISRGKIAETADAVLGRLRTGTEPAEFTGCELVVEAVPEDPALKARLLAGLAAVLAPTALLASNTSSISIDELAVAVADPARFVGMHFFNPVPASALVEIVAGAATAASTVEEIRRWVEAIGKTPIVVRDSPGFASSRLGVALGLEAIRMVEQGVASPADIDAAMVLGYKHPVGPLRLTDLVGLDVRLGIARYLAERLGPRFDPPDLMVEMVAAGRLGKKSGQGFFPW